VDNFWTSLLPSLIGGLISGIAVYLGFKLDRGAQNQDRADSAATAMMNALTQFNADTDLLKRWGNYGAHMREPLPKAPDPDAVTVAGQLLVMATEGKERTIARQILETWGTINKLDNDVTDAVRSLAGAIGAWRTGEENHAGVLRLVRSAGQS
jgi:hypothetical protein